MELRVDVLSSEEESFVEDPEFEVSKIGLEKPPSDRDVKLYHKDIVSLYFKEIGRIPLLSQKQIRHLISRVQKFRKEAAKIKNKQAKSKQLATKFQRFSDAAVEARNELMSANLRLVISIAKKYQHRGLDLADLVNEGSFGLLKAIERFDFKKGKRFSTYATWWIRASITRALAEKGRMIRLPAYLNDLAIKFKKAEVEFIRKENRKPSLKELSKIVSPKLEKKTTALFPRFLSIDAQLDDDDDRVLGDVMVDTRNISPEESVKQTDIRKLVDEAISDLAPREADVIRMRFAIGRRREYTLEEIGHLPDFGLTRERIRQIEVKALKKIRCRLQSLADLADVLNK